MTVEIYPNKVKVKNIPFDAVQIVGTDLVFARVNLKDSGVISKQVTSFHSIPNVEYIFISGTGFNGEMPPNEDLENAYQIELKRIQRVIKIDKISE